MTIRVVLADDEALLRAGLRMLLEGEPDLEVVGEAADGVQALEVIAATRPDVVLMDVRMPRLDGLSAARAVARDHPATRVLVLTTFDEEASIDAAMRAGVAGFLLKVSPPEAMLDAVRRVAAGQGALDPSVVRTVMNRYAASPGPVARAAELERLTARETDVLRLVARGLSNAEVAARLFLGETTVKTHLGRVLDKLGLRDRPAAIAFAYESGLVTPGDARSD